MLDATTVAILQNIVRRESRSLLQYVRDAFPWVALGEAGALARLQKLIDEELEAAAALNRFLVRRHAPPAYPGTFPMAFTTINFVTLQHLRPLLIDYERKAIAELDRDLVHITDAEARAQVEQLLARKRRHLEALEHLGAEQPQPAAH